MKQTILTGFIILFAASCFGQKHDLYKQLFSNKLQKPSLYSFSFVKTDRDIHPFRQQLSVLKSPVHYTAFFCKMEYASSRKLGIQVKIHAGDHDMYYREKGLSTESR